MSKRAYESFLEYSPRLCHGYGQEVFADYNGTATLIVTAMPQLYGHLRFILELFESKEPALCLTRGYSFIEVCYVFGDASISGFGLSWNRPGSEVLIYIFGIWGVEGDNTSSNIREFSDLIDSLEDMGIEKYI